MSKKRKKHGGDVEKREPNADRTRETKKKTEQVQKVHRDGLPKEQNKNPILAFKKNPIPPRITVK